MKARRRLVSVRLLRSDQSGTTWLLSFASVFYFLNLFAKSLLVASFVPAASCEGSLVCNVAIDVITAAMEINTIKYLLSHKTSLSYSAETRLLCLGLGWSVGHIVCANGSMLIRAMASVAFQWVDIYCALQASLAPLCYLSCTALIYMASKGRLPPASRAGLLVFAGLLVPGTLLHRHCLGLTESPKRFLAEEITPLCLVSLGLQAGIALSAGVACYVAFKARQRQAQAQKHDAVRGLGPPAGAVDGRIMHPNSRFSEAGCTASAQSAVRAGDCGPGELLFWREQAPIYKALAPEASLRRRPKLVCVCELCRLCPLNYYSFADLCQLI
ncbi:hypothetical protein Efla_001707 [Eimeria flavescens]